MNYPVYLALGSNLDDRLANLRAAVSGLFPGAPVCRVSSVYETPPWGVLDQPAFLNIVVEVQTAFSPQELLGYLQRLETKLGRVKTILNGPRVIDLDILFIEDQIHEGEHLTVPHPRLRGRGFVLRPLADLAENFTHPVLDLPVSTLLAECDLNGINQTTTAREFEESLLPNRFFVPVEIAQSLKENDEAARAFHALPPSHQREYIGYVSEGKKAETRQSRAQKMIDMLIEKG